MEPIILDNEKQSINAYDQLRSQKYLAVDSEGVHLGRYGPLTLMQVATSNGQVYLFDVQYHARLLKENGHLRQLLENDSIVKVMHSVKTDAEALHGQFGIQIRNVHDTQVAHQFIQRSEGQLFPHPAKLNDLCEKYCPEKAKQADKTATTRILTKSDAQYWRYRSLTAEMIQSAANDVQVLVPEIYTEQKRALEEKGLMGEFQAHVQRILDAVENPRIKRAMLMDEQQRILRTLYDFAKEGYTGQSFPDIQDENIKQALKFLRRNLLPSDAPECIRNLKDEEIMAYFEEVSNDLNTQGKDYDAYNSVRRLYACVTSIGDTELRKRGEVILKRVQKIVLEDMKTKYTMLTSGDHIAMFEKIILCEEFKRKAEIGQVLPRELESLYCAIQIDNVRQLEKSFRADRANFWLHDDAYQMLIEHVYAKHNDIMLRENLRRVSERFLAELKAQGKLDLPPEQPQIPSMHAGGDIFTPVHPNPVHQLPGMNRNPPVHAFVNPLHLPAQHATLQPGVGQPFGGHVFAAARHNVPRFLPVSNMAVPVHYCPLDRVTFRYQRPYRVAVPHHVLFKEIRYHPVNWVPVMLRQ